MLSKPTSLQGGDFCERGEGSGEEGYHEVFIRNLPVWPPNFFRNLNFNQENHRKIIYFFVVKNPSLFWPISSYADLFPILYKCSC